MLGAMIYHYDGCHTLHVFDDGSCHASWLDEPYFEDLSDLGMDEDPDNPLDPQMWPFYGWKEYDGDLICEYCGSRSVEIKEFMMCRECKALNDEEQRW